MATSSSTSMVAKTSTARQNLARQDVSTDNLLSYYSSPLADNPASSPIPISRNPSVGSTSDCSNLSYKSDSTPSDYSNKEETTTIACSSTSVTRRPSRSSKGAADRRRLAIVQVLNTSSHSTGSTAATPSSSSRSIDSRSRTGDMALVAPPDAAPASYVTEGGPESSSPISSHSSSLQSYRVRPKHETSPALPKQHHRSQGHQRSASEISNAKRDIAIIGTLTPAHSTSRSTMSAPSIDNISSIKLKASNRRVLASADDTQTSENGLYPPPLFIHPQSRSPSPVCSISSLSGNSDFVTTPDIGEGKRIDMPVASPIVVMTSTDVISPTATTASSFPSSHTTTNPTASSSSPAQPTPASPHPSHRASSNSATSMTASAIIPRSARTPQKQKTPPSIIVVPQTPNTPKSPIFVSLSSPTPSTTTASSVTTTASNSFSLDNLASFRNYQPGIHSTAGPLPPPPRASLVSGTTVSAPPPRPPRQVRSPSPTKSSTITRSPSPTKGVASAITSRSGDQRRSPRSQTKEDMMEALRLPPEVTAALSSRLAPVTKTKSNGNVGRTLSGADEKSLIQRSDDDNNSNLASNSTKPAPEVTVSVHTREGAFAPSHIVSPPMTTSATKTSTLSTSSDMAAQVYPTTTLHALPERIKVASSSSYEEYSLGEEDEESDYDTRGQKVVCRQGQANVDTPQPIIKPLPRGQSLAAFNAVGIGGLPASSVEDDDWILTDTFGGGGGAMRSTEVEGMPETPKTPRREKAPKRNSFESHASSNESEGPSPPPKSFRTSFTKGLRRLSLNASPRRSASVSSSGHSRTPSQNSSTLPALPDEANYGGRRSFSPSPSPQFVPRPPSPLNPNAYSNSSSSSNPLSNHPSPNPYPYASYYARPHPHTHKRIRNASPDALFCSELYSVPKKSTTSAERCAIYARKLNELYMYDCGLGDWVVSVSIGISRGPVANDVSVISFMDTPRKTSHGSTISEATFPRRPDASTATDLMIPTTISSSSSMSPVSSAPRLPYPSLATKNTSNEKGGLLGHLTTPTSSRGTGGFFASLGRKASINRHRGGSSDSGHGARLTKPPPHVNGNTISSPVLVNASQSIPGGPRALPGRAKTLMLSPSPRSSKGQSDAGSGSESGSRTVGRRPSMYNLSSSSVSDSSHGIAGSERRDKEREDDPAFNSQVNRLADLLPHVEKTVLAGYLKRAGQDILAIGQYLDDEKNGCVRRD